MRKKSELLQVLVDNIQHMRYELDILVTDLMDSGALDIEPLFTHEEYRVLAFSVLATNMPKAKYLVKLKSGLEFYVPFPPDETEPQLEWIKKQIEHYESKGE